MAAGANVANRTGLAGAAGLQRRTPCRSIARSASALRVDDAHGVQCVHVLRAAGLVAATVVYDAQDTPFAIVHGITHEGPATLARDSEKKPLA